MLHPSYSDLINKVNETSEDDTPVVNSRYSIVMATSKRARQIIGGESSCTEEERMKPLSTAVRELNEGSLRIVAAEAEDDDLAEKLALTESAILLAHTAHAEIEEEPEKDSKENDSEAEVQ